VKRALISAEHQSLLFSASLSECPLDIPSHPFMMRSTRSRIWRVAVAIPRPWCAVGSADNWLFLTLAFLSMKVVLVGEGLPVAVR